MSTQYTNEQDPRWTAIENYQLPHLFPLTRPRNAPLHSALSHCLSNSASHNLEDISIYASQGRFLALQCQIINATQILEIGTLGAYSTIWLASASPESRVTTIEYDATIAAVARENLAFAGLSGRVEMVEGKALEVLPGLAERVEQKKYDFVFIDADKTEYVEYFDWAVRLTRKGGLIYVDNMARKGLLADEREVRAGNANVIGIRRLVEAAGRDERVECVILQTVGDKNYDGFMLALVK